MITNVQEDSGLAPESGGLSPAQSSALHFLHAWHSKAPVLQLACHHSLGKSTVLRQFAQETGALWLDARDFVAEVVQGHPLAIEDATKRLLSKAFAQNPRIVIDDFQLLYDFAGQCTHYPRTNFYECVMKTIQLEAADKNCQLTLGTDWNLPEAFSNVAWSTSIESFAVEDYRFLFQAMVGELPEVDFESVFRFAPNLDCHQIVKLCRWLQLQPEKSTSEFLDHIQSQGMSSNVEISEVQDVELQDLFGVDEIVTALEDHIILPIENLKLAAQFGLTPKRGVMLAGPPGTGKTTIGRALARRMRGKFFLIDGTMISGTEGFYHQVDYVFRRAIANAPSIVFIDDSDVIFESGREHGLYRYLLTKLDGLESESVNNVCVMMTAMDLGNIPPALVRSGRIELWLEMKFPDGPNRRRLLEKLFGDKVQVEEALIWPEIESATVDFSGADLKRLVQDAKLRLAIDIARDRPLKKFEEYLFESTATIRDSRSAYAAAAQRAMTANPNRPRWFNIHPELFENSGS